METDYSVGEALGPVLFQFGVLNGNIAFDVNVNFSISDGTAIGT